MVPAQITKVGAHAFTAVGSFRGLAVYMALSCLLAQATLADPARLTATALRQQMLQQELQLQLHAASDEAIVAFYNERDFAPVWMDTKRLAELKQLAKLAELHGLDAGDYYLIELAHRISVLLYTDSNTELIQLELLATRSITRLAGHLRFGKTDPGAYYGITSQDIAATDAQRLLAGAAKSASLFAYLDSLTPDTLIYRKLLLTLARYRAMDERGELWPIVDAGPVLEPGMRDPRVPALRERLGLTAHVDREAAVDDLYDATVAEAVVQFQIKHAMAADGRLGPRTRRALNVSLQDRISQLRVNMEWQRWGRLDGRAGYLHVNIPHYTLSWIEGGKRAWSMRTQVGKSRRQTPVFKSAVNAIMANPAWTVPPTIFREDVLPQLQADPDYLRQQRMYVVDNQGRPVNAAHINWQTTTAAEFPYRVRARPGAGNALGKIKFLVPNPHLIYLHDTPSRHLFQSTNRAVSSGCIRVEKPEQLAEFLVARQNKVSTARLRAAMDADGTRYIGLDEPIPIVVTYATIDIDDHGELIFARDIYRKDAKVLAMLDAPQAPNRQLLLAELRPVHSPDIERLQSR